MKAHYVSPNTSHMDNALSIDTIHLSIGHRLDPEMIKSWKYIKGARIRKINTPLGNIVLTYYQNKYNSMDYYSELNSVLFSCGFAQIYVRHPFDCLLLYCANSFDPIDTLYCVIENGRN